MQYSLKTEQGQSNSSKTEPYASRLREERLRIEPHQGNFAAKIGVTRNRQSFLENGERELRAEYLDLISGHGLDVMYILTGRRSGSLLSIDESRVLDSMRRMATPQQRALVTVAIAMGGDDRTDPMIEDQQIGAVHDPKEDCPPPAD